MSPTSTHSGRLILLADDDVMIRNLVRAFLQGQAFEILAASDGNEAVELSRTYRGAIDLFLTDVEMPLLNGISAYRQIDVQRPGIKVLFMSGGTQLSDMPETSPFISKPFELKDLLAQIEVILGNPTMGLHSNSLPWSIHRS